TSWVARWRRSGWLCWTLSPNTSGTCWCSVPPSATFSTCSPRQIANTGTSSRSARSTSSSSRPSRSAETSVVLGCAASPNREGSTSPPPVRTSPSTRPQSAPRAAGSRWGVAAGHALAAEAAAHVLGAGGNAIDAGVAAGICLGVVHCDMVSVAGVAPILVHLARTGETFQVSGVGPYPGASTLEYFRGLGNQIPPGLPRTVVPAAPARMARAEAREGGSRAAAVRAARDEFYRGETAARIAEFHRAEKGPLTAEDLASFEVEVERAIVGTYGPWQVGVCGFWCQGP